MERQFAVKRKVHEETKKGKKHGVRFSNDDGENLLLFFDSESEVEAYNISDLITVKIVNPQKTLDVPT